ncbi:MAG: excinuclease ABC subunit UvrC [Candidatus Saccharimonadales bacterium]
MNNKLQDKLKTLPLTPGVYFHKDKTGEIIYVGKAAILKNRVKQYFQSQRDMDVKTLALVAEIVDTDWIETESEIDALFLEAEMVKRYMPRYNILLRDDKSLMYVRIDMKSDWPYVSFTRHPLDDKAEYYGPFYNGFALKKALRYLRQVFPYYVKFPGFNPGSGRADLDMHLGLSPSGMTQLEYKTNLKKLISYVKGNRKDITRELERDMMTAAENQNFELAANLRNKLQNLRELQRRVMFGDKEFLDISKDQALSDIRDLFNLEKIPARIEGYDISHVAGSNVVASMVVFKNGVSARDEYRKFKITVDKNDDFFNMNEALTRRLSERNLTSWGKPNLVLIDGGKGQLDAALKARAEKGCDGIPFIGLSKRDEQIVIASPKKHTIKQKQTLRGLTLQSEKLKELGGYADISDNFTIINLPKSSHIIKLLQRIRDESHRFAVSYHTSLRSKKQTASQIDSIPGIGPKTRSKLIRKFGSIKNLKNISESELTEIIGASKAKLISESL